MGNTQAFKGPLWSAVVGSRGGCVRGKAWGKLKGLQWRVRWAQFLSCYSS